MNKIERRLRRKRGIRKKIFGTSSKPRITVFKSNRHVYVQAIDDAVGRTIGFSSDRSADVKKSLKGASVIGEKLAEALVKIHVKQGVFDRNGYPYHGIVKEIAEGIRKGGMRI